MYKVILVIDDALEVAFMDWEAEDGSSAKKREDIKKEVEIIQTEAEAVEDVSDDENLLQLVDALVDKELSEPFSADEIFSELRDTAQDDLHKACPDEAGVYFMRCKFAHYGPDNDGEYESCCEVIGEVEQLSNFDSILGRLEINI